MVPAAALPPNEVLKSQLAGTRSKQSVRVAVWEILRPRITLLVFCVFLIGVGRAAALVLPYSTKFLIDDVISKHQLGRLPVILWAVLIATAVQAICAFTTTQLLSKAAWRLITDLRIQVQAHVARLPISYFDENRTGNLVSRVMSDVEGVRNLMGTGFIEFLGGLLTALFAFLFALKISWLITVVVVSFMGAFGLLQRKVFATIRPIAVERSHIMADVTGRLTESFSGIRVVKSYRAEGRESEVFALGARRLLRNVLSAIGRVSVTTMASTLVLGLVAIVMMMIGAREILAGKMTLGGYISFSMLLAMMVSPMVQVVAIGTQLTEAFAGLERTIELLRIPREDDDARRTRTIEPEALTGHFRFDNVSFSYIEGKEVLHEISFEARPGTVTALVGSSGSGKSTIIGLISAFITANKGSVLVDDIDLATVRLDSYRSRLGVVLQESFLFEGTIYENIAFARPEASEAEVYEAARIARVDEFVQRLAERYDTIVGERGIKLSGGQRQRVSIACAILANPRILILDEATSSLDSESEALIQEGLSYLVEGRTTFVIAHRLSTIRSADQILIIEDGRIVERGNHAELYQRQGRYYDLYTRQHSLESNLFLAAGEGSSSLEEDEEQEDKTPLTRAGQI